MLLFILLLGSTLMFMSGEFYAVKNRGPALIAAVFGLFFLVTAIGRAAAITG